MRIPIYPIPRAAYLFQSSPEVIGDLNSKEEPVRQWCAFELIRAYGITIGDLNFEEKVRVGSKTYRIDILIRRNGIPWIVVECKEPKFSNHDHGLAQAVSYAGAETISAEYAVYTNGTAWQVKRRVDREWNAVPDLPVSGPARPLGSIDELLRAVGLVSPLLHKIDEPLSGKNARLYLEALQSFFNGSNLITSGVDHDLRFAVDNLLRVLATGPKEEHYSQSKLAAAARLAEAFRAKSGIGFPLAEIHADESVFMFMSALAASMHPLLDAGREISGVNQELVRLFLSLLDYGRTQAREAYPLFPSHLHTSLRGFLTKAMSLSMDVQVPVALEERFTSDMKHFCGSSWDDLVRNDINEQAEIRRDFFSALFASLAFWRRLGRKG